MSTAAILLEVQGVVATYFSQSFTDGASLDILNAAVHGVFNFEVRVCATVQTSDEAVLYLQGTSSRVVV